MTGQVWTPSNCLSFLRVVLVLPIATLVASDIPERRFIAAGLILLAIATDYFDGILARKPNQVTDLGKVIGPMADKIAIGIVGLMLVVHGRMPLWFIFVALLRDVLIFSGGLYVKRTRGILLQSNLAGKWTVTVMAVYFLLTVLDFSLLEWLKLFLLY